MKNFFGLLFIALTVTSCHKEAEQKAKSEVSSQPAMVTNQPEMSAAQIAYMESSPQVDIQAIQKVLEKCQNQAVKSKQVWGISVTREVFKWNGSGWDEPNSAAGLDYIDVSNNGDAVWGISQTHIYKWNGAWWDEPNSAAGLYYISAIDANTAIGIGYNGTPYVTTNGGLSWGYLGTMSGLSCLNIGNESQKFAVGVRYSGTSAQLVYYNLSTNTWSTQATNQHPTWVDFVSPIQSNQTPAFYYIAYNSLQAYGSIRWNAFGQTTSNELEPDPGAVLQYLSSTGSGDEVWGISNSEIFKSVTACQSWTEPNPAARLKIISAGGY